MHDPSEGWLAKYRNELGLIIANLVVVGLVLLVDKNRDYIQNPKNVVPDILNQTALLGVFALGSAVVIIAGGIDLSSGSVIIFSGSICGIVMMLFAPIGDDGNPDTVKVGVTGVVAGIAAAVIVGAMIGTFHSWLITVIRLPPFVATLASLVGLRSLSKVLNQAVTERIGTRQTTIQADSDVLAALGTWWVPLVVFLVLGLLFWILMSYTIVGRHLYALGGNESAARLTGVRTDRLKWLAYTLSAVTSSIAGVLYVAKVSSANPSTLAIGYELNAIAAAVVGGCSLQGGVGLIPGVMLGVLFLRIVIDAIAKIVRTGSDDYQGMIVGLLVVLAVTFNEFRRQTGSQRVQFFPGWLGVAVIPVLSILVGATFFVMSDVSHRLKYGLAAAGLGLVVFSLMKFMQARR